MSVCKKITSDDERKIIELYEAGKSGPEILIELNNKFKTVKTIYDCLKKFGISRKEKWEYSHHDHFYFNKIDTPNKAYVLGLMVSDGWVSPEKNIVGVQLQKSDGYIIEQIKLEWKTNNKIIDCYKKSFLSLDGTKIYTPQMMKRIAVNSPKMIEDLKCLGISARKSKTVILPVVDEEVDSHLFRGIVDGDGSIYIHNNRKDICIRIVGSHYLVAQCCLYLHKRLGINYHYPSSRENISYVDYSSKSEVIILANFLYKDINKSFCIERKRNIIENYII